MNAFKDTRNKERLKRERERHREGEGGREKSGRARTGEGKRLERKRGYIERLIEDERQEERDD